jgi:tRNA U34 5-methylaminomethyl-2-thiouridine-forming methyltransferase MnmC
MPESMHHSGGAARETLYIYTQPFLNTLNAIEDIVQNDFSVGIVGLGLGYIELSFLQSLKNKSSIGAQLTSFEKDQELIDTFEAWLFKEQKNSVYDLICEKLAVKKSDLLEVLKFISWARFADLNLQTQITKPFHFVAYDAFSQYTDGPLWTDEFLDFFLQKHCAKDCVFTTYACTGNLKRALLRNGFTFFKRPGFSGKRDATLALRGEFSSRQHLFQNV